jgi:hypothetical protein
MGDMNGGPGYGGGGGGPQWNTYGRGPQQQRPQMEPPTPWFGGFGGGNGTNWGRPQEGYGSWGGGGGGWGGGNPWCGGWQNWQQGGGTSNSSQQPQSGFQNAPGLYQQYQGMQPGADRDALVRQMQGSDQGAAFRAAMRGANYQLDQGPGGTFSYSGGPGAPRSADSVAGQGGQPPPQTGTYSSQGPAPRPMPSYDEMMRQAAQYYQNQFTPNQQMMMQSGRGQRGYWQGPTSPYGMQGPPGNPYTNFGPNVGGAGRGYNATVGGGMQNGAPK